MSEEQRTDALLKRVNPTIRKLLEAQCHLIRATDHGDKASQEKHAKTFNDILEYIAAETMP